MYTNFLEFCEQYQTMQLRIQQIFVTAYYVLTTAGEPQITYLQNYDFQLPLGQLYIDDYKCVKKYKKYPGHLQLLQGPLYTGYYRDHYAQVTIYTKLKKYILEVIIVW